ncbi:hypothetical protein ACFFGT_17345 [Mucilaginibacter angelicae]|uniref:MFS transporter n=1 Tax=Mucilaginibacter angelicae TaxID=869718 RepID=A0ABV6L931_9SPHI
MLNSPFHASVPEWVRTPGVIILLLSQIVINPLQQTDLTSVASRIGDERDLIQLAAGLNTVGLVTCIPIVGLFQRYFQRSRIWLFCLTVQSIIALVIVHPAPFAVVAALSFLSGSLKAICLLDAVSLLMSRVNPSGSRGVLYAIYYPISYVFSQLSTYMSALLLDQHEWYEIYYCWYPGLFLSVMIVGFMMHREKDGSAISLKEIDWLGYAFAVISGSTLAYFCIMGERLDWFSDSSISWSFFLFLLSTILFIWRRWDHPKPYVNLNVLWQYKQIRWGISFMFLLYTVYNSAAVFSIFLMQNFHNDALQVAASGLWQLPSFLIAIPLTGYWLHKNQRARETLAIGFFLYVFYTWFLSRISAPNVDQQQLIIAQLLRGLSYGISITSLSYFTSMNIAPKDSPSRLFYSVYTRYFLASFTTAAFFRRWLLVCQTKYYESINSRIATSPWSFTETYGKLRTVLSRRGINPDNTSAYAIHILQSKAHQESIILATTEIFTVLVGMSLLLALSSSILKVFNMHYNKSKNQHPVAELSELKHDSVFLDRKAS